MGDDFQTLFNWGGSAIMAGLSWFAKTLWDGQQKSKEDLAKFREDVAKEYVRENTFNSTIAEIRSMFRHISDKLDEKADKR